MKIRKIVTQKTPYPPPHGGGYVFFLTHMFIFGEMYIFYCLGTKYRSFFTTCTLFFIQFSILWGCSPENGPKHPHVGVLGGKTVLKQPKIAKKSLNYMKITENNGKIINFGTFEYVHLFWLYYGKMALIHPHVGVDKTIFDTKRSKLGNFWSFTLFCELFQLFLYYFDVFVYFHLFWLS